MLKLSKVFAGLLIGLIVAVGIDTALATYADQDTYKMPNSYYGRSDGWFLDSSYNLVQIANGSAVMTLATSGEKITFANSEYIANDTDGEIEFSNGTEDISIDFGTNVVNFTSDTAVVGIDFAAVGTTITLANDQTIVSDTNNEIQFGDNSEDISLGFGTANTVDLSSDTGVVGFDFGAVGTTITLANDQTIGSGTDNKITLADNSEDVTIEFKTNELEWSSSTGVVKTDFGALAIEGSSTLQILSSGATIGWATASAGNTACTTTCGGTGGCVAGFDAGGSTFVDCDAATADTCLCAGPSS